MGFVILVNVADIAPRMRERAVVHERPIRRDSGAACLPDCVARPSCVSVSAPWSCASAGAVFVGEGSASRLAKHLACPLTVTLTVPCLHFRGAGFFAPAASGTQIKPTHSSTAASRDNGDPVRAQRSPPDTGVRSAPIGTA